MDELISSLKCVAEEVCRLLQKSPFPFRNWNKINRNGEGCVYYYTDPIPDTLMISKEISLIIDKIGNLPQFIETMNKKLLNDSCRIINPTGGSIQDIADKRDQIIRHFIIPLLIDYFRNRKAFTYDDLISQTVIENHLSRFFSETITMISISPLSNIQFANDSDYIELEEKVRVRATKTEEIETWLNPDFPLLLGYDIQPQYVSEIPTVIEITQKYTADYQGNWNKAFSEFCANAVEGIVQMLRLAFDINVFVHFTQTHSRGGFGIPRTTISPPKLSSKIPLLYRPFCIKSESCTYIRKIYPILFTGINSDTIKLAISRWSMAAERPTTEDKLIDYWIGLESLFLSEGNQEVKKSLEFDYPPPKEVAFRRIHGSATAISNSIFRHSLQYITTC